MVLSPAIYGKEKKRPRTRIELSPDLMRAMACCKGVFRFPQLLPTCGLDIDQVKLNFKPRTLNYI